MTTGSIVVSFIAIIAIILVLILFLRFVPLGLWISARAAGVRVRIISLIAMRFRRVNPFKVVLPMIKATKAGLDLDMNELEAHLLAGGPELLLPLGQGLLGLGQTAGQVGLLRPAGE